MMKLKSLIFCGMAILILTSCDDPSRGHDVNVNNNIPEGLITSSEVGRFQIVSIDGNPVSRQILLDTIKGNTYNLEVATTRDGTKYLGWRPFGTYEDDSASLSLKTDKLLQESSWLQAQIQLEDKYSDAAKYADEIKKLISDETLIYYLEADILNRDQPTDVDGRLKLFEKIYQQILSGSKNKNK